jgi:hypothetical protein
MDAEPSATTAEVVESRAASRSDPVRRGTARRQSEDEAILLELAHRGEAVYPDLAGLTDLPHPSLD